MEGAGAPRAVGPIPGPYPAWPEPVCRRGSRSHPALVGSNHCFPRPMRRPSYVPEPKPDMNHGPAHGIRCAGAKESRP
jgi:hypothetical protein